MKVTLAELLGKISAKEGDALERKGAARIAQLKAEASAKRLADMRHRVVKVAIDALREKIGFEPTAEERIDIIVRVGRALAHTELTMDRPLTEDELEDMADMFKFNNDLP